MSQHPADVPPEEERQPVRSLVVPPRADVVPPGLLRAGGPPPEVLRQWSDALAAAGLYTEALEVHPAIERVDVVRQAELAVLAGIHTTALDLLGELAAAKTERTRRTVAVLKKDQDRAPAPSPWLELLARVAELLAGTGDLDTVRTAAQRVQPSAGLDWIVALAAVSVGDLEAAAPRARAARDGGCRDLRMLTVAAADLARVGDYAQALRLTGQAQRIALPDEDPAALTVHVLQRCGFPQQARALAVAGVGDATLAPSFRTDWKAAASGAGASSLGVLGQRVKVHGRRAQRRVERRTREADAIAGYDLTCRCYGSGGWIGSSRLFYLEHHLHELLPAPVAGLDARLMICRATNLVFLDLVAREITLPVPAGTPAETPAPDAEETSPTPGMGVSLGMALPA
ncbi:hypothetical protein KIH74_12355 [Kineosporia sp. J2-2]|uniref:Tetratricopeptide repeat protein n=1 Tax=Kineosporia corallincola TaxID=2835133 RepID=A0ABS5THQ6_9ACTN|nr:hypothetical protein [Kineosporia corallincola]MBT0769721.1 hypothetical protein [Kineosporia corallincola]